LFISQAKDGIRDFHVTGVQTCALPILVVRGPEHGAGILLEPSHHQNGHTVDAQGRLLAASHGERAVVRREADGAWMTLTNSHDEIGRASCREREKRSMVA